MLHQSAARTSACQSPASVGLLIRRSLVRAQVGEPRKTNKNNDLSLTFEAGLAPALFFVPLSCHFGEALDSPCECCTAAAAHALSAQRLA